MQPTVITVNGLGKRYRLGDTASLHKTIVAIKRIIKNSFVHAFCFIKSLF